jgi:septal ring factor EnvC (AmiA/AmiB activator)
LLLAFLPGLSSAQSDEQETRTRLDQLQRDIKRTNSEISSANVRKNKLQQQLRQDELELGKLQGAIAANQRVIKGNQRELDTLNNQRKDLEQARDTQQARIALELKTAWQLGQQSQVKVLLNQENPNTVARAMAYYRYFFQARNKLMEGYRETLRQLQELELRITATQAQLASQQSALEQQQVQLATAQQDREQTVAQLNDSIDSKGEQLRQMEQNRKELEAVLKAIEKAVAELAVPKDYKPFKSAKGKLPWPVSGKRSNNFGRPRNEGKMRWQGVTIPAQGGTTVQAVHHGRVVYADWLRGSGLLIIIDHGDGYMSLYAHNQSLLREVGEWVIAGTPISTVGNSGGQERTALYFEIRHKGKPVNPTKWCKS